MKRILAIDQSTSATKALLFSETGALLDKTAVSHQQIYPQPGWVEHDANEIYRNTLQAVATLLQRNEEKQDNLLCLSITNQRETVVVFDKATGKPLHNAIVWQCRRGEAICAELEAAGYGDLVQSKTGLKIDTYFPASKLTWLQNNHPNIKKKLEAGEALIGTIDAYLVYRLTNGRAFATDQTNASRTLLFDINTLGWDAELCQLFSVPQAALPEVRDSDAKFGETDLDGVLKRPLPIVGIMGDSQGALFAQRCFAPGSAKVTFGTGSSVMLNIGSEVAYSDKGIVTAVAWVVDSKPVYAFEGITNFTGATITWLRDQLGLIDSVEETEELAMAVSDNGGVYLVPAFVGLSAPYWQPNARAAIVGLTPASNKNHVVRAALEGIGFRIRDVLTLMATEAQVDLQTVHADGGAVSNGFLMQFVADMNQLQVHAAQTPELSALGAVFCGCLGLKIYTSLDDLKNLPSGYTAYSASMPPDRVSELVAGWKTAVQQVLCRSQNIF